MELFFTSGTCALASLISLIEAGADFSVNRISFKRSEQTSPDYLAVNPKARVPALRIGDSILTETPAILAYIAQSFPAARLMPADPLGFAQVQAFNSYICSTLHVAHAHRMRGYRWTDDEAAIRSMQAKVPQSVGACFDYIERHAFTGPYVFDSYSVADPYLFTVARWMEGDGVDPARFPKVAAHREMMQERDAVKAALEYEKS